MYSDLTVPQAAAGGRKISLPTGRGLGGGSSVNTLTWFQGHPADFDGWDEEGAEGWGWDEMLPVMRRVEHHILGNGPFHGAGGPMTIDFPRDINPSAMAFIAAGEQLGLPVSSDLNGCGRTGFGIAQANIRDGVRHSVVDGYLRPALGRPNLVVRTGARVVRLLFDGRKATGVRLRTGQLITARRGVILAAGSLRTPQLLMLSGVGPAGHLSVHGVPVVADLPGVGANAMDDPRPVNTNSRRAWSAETMKASVPTISRVGDLTSSHVRVPPNPPGPSLQTRSSLVSTAPPNEEAHRDADDRRQKHERQAQPPSLRRAEANMGLSRAGCTFRLRLACKATDPRSRSPEPTKHPHSASRIVLAAVGLSLVVLTACSSGSATKTAQGSDGAGTPATSRPSTTTGQPSGNQSTTGAALLG